MEIDAHLRIKNRIPILTQMMIVTPPQNGSEHFTLVAHGMYIT